VLCRRAILASSGNAIGEFGVFTQSLAAADPAGVRKVGACLARQNEREWVGSCPSRRAAFAQRGRSVEELVKGIGVATRIAVGRKTPIVSITYRFEAPGVASPDAARLFSVRLVRTGVDAERRPGSPRDGYVPFG